MNGRVHPRLEFTFAIAWGLVQVAQEITRVANRQLAAPPRKRGSTLRPGPGSPTWNALVVAILPLMKVRGEKVKLSRILGIPRSRLHEYLKSKSAMPDAERTLLLILWLAQRRAGRAPG